MFQGHTRGGDVMDWSLGISEFTVIFTTGITVHSSTDLFSQSFPYLKAMDTSTPRHHTHAWQASLSKRQHSSSVDCSITATYKSLSTTVLISNSTNSVCTEASAGQGLDHMTPTLYFSTAQGQGTPTLDAHFQTRTYIKYRGTDRARRKG